MYCGDMVMRQPGPRPKCISTNNGIDVSQTIETIHNKKLSYR